LLVVDDDRPGFPRSPDGSVEVDRLDGGGNGLGLAITRELLERHDGRLEIAAGDGEGATVVLRLPRVPAVV